MSDDTAETTRRLESYSRYNASPKGVLRHARYNRSAKRVAVQVRYKASTKGILAEERHYQKRTRGAPDGV